MRQYEQTVPIDSQNTKVVAVGQTRNGNDEWVTPVVVWERHKETGVMHPPGTLAPHEISMSYIMAITKPVRVKANEFEQIEIDGATQLTPSKFSGATKAKIEVRQAQVNYRIDGGAPTKTEGHLLTEGDILELQSPEDIERFIAINVNDYAILSITYFIEVRDYEHF